MATRTFKTRIKSRACENFGAVDYVLTDVITEQDGGLTVVTTARGTCEGARVDERHEKHYPGASMQRAADYRLTNGYTEVK